MIDITFESEVHMYNSSVNHFQFCSFPFIFHWFLNFWLQWMFPFLLRIKIMNILSGTTVFIDVLFIETNGASIFTCSSEFNIKLKLFSLTLRSFKFCWIKYQSRSPKPYETRVIILNRGSMFAFQWREFSPPLSSALRLLQCYHSQWEMGDAAIPG